MQLAVSCCLLAVHTAEAQQTRHQTSMLVESAFRPIGVWQGHLLLRTEASLLLLSASSCACTTIPLEAEVHAAEAFSCIHAAEAFRHTAFCMDSSFGTCALLQCMREVASCLGLMQSSYYCCVLPTAASSLLKLLLHPLLM